MAIKSTFAFSGPSSPPRSGPRSPRTRMTMYFSIRSWTSWTYGWRSWQRARCPGTTFLPGLICTPQPLKNRGGFETLWESLKYQVWTPLRGFCVKLKAGVIDVWQGVDRRYRLCIVCEAWLENVLTQNILDYALSEFYFPMAAPGTCFLLPAGVALPTMLFFWGGDFILAADLCCRNTHRSVHAQTRKRLNTVRMEAHIHIMTELF